MATFTESSFSELRNFIWGLTEKQNIISNFPNDANTVKLLNQDSWPLNIN